MAKKDPEGGMNGKSLGYQWNQGEQEKKKVHRTKKMYTLISVELCSIEFPVF